MKIVELIQRLHTAKRRGQGDTLTPEEVALLYRYLAALSAEVPAERRDSLQRKLDHDVWSEEEL
jgi:hypothetical protein